MNDLQEEKISIKCKLCQQYFKVKRKYFIGSLGNLGRHLEYEAPCIGGAVHIDILVTFSGGDLCPRCIVQHLGSLVLGQQRRLPRDLEGEINE